MSSRFNRDLVAQFLEELERQDQAREAKTVRVLWAEWYVVVQKTPRQKPIKDHSRFLDVDFEAGGQTLRIGDLKWADCTPEVLMGWLAMLDRFPVLHGKRRGQPISPGYADQVRTSLQGCFHWHVKQRNIPYNPLEGLPRPKGHDKKRRGYFTPEALARFLPHCRPILADMLMVSAESTGLRNSAVRGMLKDKVDFPGRKVAYVAKGGLEKIALVSDLGMDIIARWSKVSRGPYVFGSPFHADGRMIREATFNRWMRDAAINAGISLAGERPTFHHARHTFAANALLQNANPSLLANQLGLTSTKVLTDRYGNMRGALEDMVREAMNKSPLGAVYTGETDPHTQKKPEGK